MYLSPEANRPTENDIRAHRFQNLLYATIRAIHRGYVTEDPSAIINPDSVLGIECYDLPRLMTEAALTTKIPGYKADVLGDDPGDNYQVYRNSVGKLVEVFSRVEGKITVGNQMDHICAGCLIGRHCLPATYPGTGDKDINTIYFLKNIAEYLGVQDVEYQEEAVKLDMGTWVKRKLTLPAAFMRETTHKVGQFLYAEMLQSVENHNRWWPLKIDIDQLIYYDRSNLVTNERDLLYVVWSFVADRAGEPKAVEDYLDFISR